MSRLVRLYPAAWLERYEAEFLELLATSRPSITDRIDIVRGVLDAHLARFGAGLALLFTVVVVVLMGYGVSTTIDRMAGGVLLTIAATAFVPAWLGVGATLLSPRPV